MARDCDKIQHQTKSARNTMRSICCFPLTALKHSDGMIWHEIATRALLVTRDTAPDKMLGTQCGVYLWRREMRLDDSPPTAEPHHRGPYPRGGRHHPEIWGPFDNNVFRIDRCLVPLPYRRIFFMFFPFARRRGIQGGSPAATAPKPRVFLAAV